MLAGIILSSVILVSIFFCERDRPMNLLLVIVILIVLFGGGGGYYAYGRAGYVGLGGVLGPVILILVLIYFFGGGLHARW